METTEKHQDNDIESVAQAKNKENSRKRPVENDEIDLLALAQDIWQRRKTILYTTIGTFIIGIFIAIVSPEEYTTNVVLMPQSEEAGSNSSSNFLKQIGGLAGVGVGDNSTGLSKGLYPDITQSTPFYLFLMQEELYFPSLDTTMSLYHYFTEVSEPTLQDHLKKYTLGLPRILLNLPLKVMSWFKEDKSPASVETNTASPADTLKSTQLGNSGEIEYEIIALNNKQIKAISSLKERVSTTIQPNGMVMVSSEMPDPLVAANTTRLAVAYLTKYVTEYRINKAQENLDFIEKQFLEKEERYEAAQQRLARIRDQNLNIATENARIAIEQAQTDYNLAYSLYQSVAQQLEQARIKVQEETPVFKVLEPIQIPLKTSEPKRELIIALAIFTGIALGLGIIVAQVIFSNVKSNV
ncbi:Wzz/FepE/Etk N-terminal domain-containing protein [Porifericola rhodea]|uniref:Wzz/FepE/Etk N-terminal domain-containing protein n=1 Tax=Porifericola rhodea TaxID=930972 RepID=UPI0026666B9E|nr:Wzz/FepE/Etk N-terminal domain-containing protein [Porifericola rhodea]WKN33499.1 Wzz/FepE/Etk N-terminal domain-containing protein [Porifericola rhodea]